METRPPTITQLLVAVAFALSCFALLLFLWISFGGPTPLKPKGYRVDVPFDEASQLAIDDRYAPIPEDARAILRQKTLLGETYVELTPGSPGEPDGSGASDDVGV